MKIFEISKMTENCGSGYISIHDGGFQAERVLIIDDERGGRVELKNEEIGELFKRIKPALYG